MTFSVPEEPAPVRPIAGPVAALLLLTSALASLIVAVVAAAVAGAAKGDGFVFGVTAICGFVLAVSWLGVSLTIAASRDMSMRLQTGLLISSPVVPILVAAAAAAGLGGAVVILTLVVATGLLLEMRKIFADADEALAVDEADTRAADRK
jgi:hypothetical protein